MKRLGFDLHAGAGLLGVAAAGWLSVYNQWTSAFVVTATAAYMLFKAIREYRKLRKEK